MAGLACSLHSPLSHSPTSQSSTLFHLTSFFSSIIPLPFYVSISAFSPWLPFFLLPPFPIDTVQSYPDKRSWFLPNTGTLHYPRFVQSLHKEGFAVWFWAHGVSRTSFCLWLLHYKIGKSAESHWEYMHQHFVKRKCHCMGTNRIELECWQPVSLPAVDYFSTAAVTDHWLSLNPLCFLLCFD